VAEHAPDKERGRYTSWIQASAAFGLIAALGVIYITRKIVGEVAFADWGWRIPFIISTGLLIVSIYIRTKTAESPTFKALHDKGAVSKTPFKDSFAKWSNLKQVLIALFGFMTAQGVIWYTAFFYTQVFLEKSVKLDGATVNYLIMGMTLVSAPLYIVFATLSDKLGRKPVMIFGMALAVLSFFPGFQLMTKFANPALDQAIRNAPVVIVTNPATCQVQLDLIGRAQFVTPCDLAKSMVTNLGIPYVNEKGSTSLTTATVKIGTQLITVPSGEGLDKSQLKALKTKTTDEMRAALKLAGYPEKADPKTVNLWGIFGVLTVFAIAATALYGPMASALVEMFPTKVRYTAMSLPYHVGTGWFGGLLPAVAFAMVAGSGNIYFGLWYPVITGGLAIIVAIILAYPSTPPLPHQPYN
jgi:MFS family permease